jgi:hypothetical protein
MRPNSFIPFRTHLGAADVLLGINVFWSEKLLLFLLYLERAALLLLWNLGWPSLFYTHTTYVYGFLLDLTAHHDGVAALGRGTLFEGCVTICKIVWPVVCLGLIGVWALVGVVNHIPLYYTRNAERVLWGVVRIIYLPFVNTLVRYFIQNMDGNLDLAVMQWTTPVSEIGVLLLFITVVAVLGIAYIRSSRQVLFKSSLRHESFLRGRELEYVLRFGATYRNERIWMISSYTYEAWWWSLDRMVVDTILLMLVAFVTPSAGIIVAAALLGLHVLYTLLWVRVYRCVSTAVIEFALETILFVFTIFGALQANGIRDALFEGNGLDYFLFALLGAGVVAFIGLSIYYFIDGHVFKWNQTLADRRAERKWKKTFLPQVQQAESKRKKDDGDGEEDTAAASMSGDAAQNQQQQQLMASSMLGHSMVHLKDSTSFMMERAHEHDALDEEEFVKENRRMEEANRTQDKASLFYVPRPSKLVAVNAASPHVWPVNTAMINELLRRNQMDHLIDVLRAARKMLDRISALHNSPVLIPTDELKSHIQRLQHCVTYCKRTRITHHANVIHPLQSTFEDLIEQFTYELRVFSGRSVTVGHNARKMIEVSRYLRARFDKREHVLALLSPQMRRILLKLFALRIFCQLVEERPDFLLPKKYQGPGEDVQSEGGDSDSSYGTTQAESRHAAGYRAFARGRRDTDVLGASDAFQAFDGAGLGDGDDDADARHQQRLAEMLRQPRPDAGFTDVSGSRHAL